MTKKTFITALVFVLFAFAGCRKEPLPETVTTDPVFFMSAKIQGVAVRIEAGTDGYEMSPGFYQESNGVYVFTSQLKKSGCQSCYELTVRLNDHVVSAANAPVHIDSALRQGKYLLNDKPLPPAQYRVKLRPGAAKDPTGSYEWTVKSAGYADQVFKSYEAEFLAGALENYTVSLFYTDATGCSNTLVRYFRPGFAPAADILAQRQGSGLDFKFSASVTGGQPVSYHWDFGDGESSGDVSPLHSFAPSPGFYTVTLTVSYADGRTTTAHYQVPGTTDPVCLANFGATLDGDTEMSPLSKVIVELRDPSGRVYSSLDFVQPAGSVFEIVSVEDYQVNGQGYRTKRYKALFNCVLRQNGQEITVTDGEVSLGVAYP